MSTPSLLCKSLVLLVGCYWIYDGLERGHLYASLVNRPPTQMTVLQVRNLGGRVIFPDYEAIGTVEGFDSPVVVDIFQNQFRQLKPEGRGRDPYPLNIRKLDVHRLTINGETFWIADSKVAESRPIFTVLGLSFSWHFPSGILLVAAAVTWFRSERKRRLKDHAAEEIRSASRRSRWRMREAWFRRKGRH